MKLKTDYEHSEGDDQDGKDSARASSKGPKSLIDAVLSLILGK